MMRWIYITIIALVFIRLAVLPQSGEAMETGIAERIVLEASVPNSISGILLRNRLYDTIFEVFVFMLAVLGVQYAFSLKDTEEDIFHMHDANMVILARIGAMVSALIFLELTLRGHLAPGGGFAAGVAGGSAIGLISLTGNVHNLYAFYQRWHIGTLEKILVVLLLLLGVGFLLLPDATIAGKPSGAIMIPVLNVLIAAKVAIGSWTIVLLFIRHRGLL